ncbi:MAG TPA: cyclic nucleotide-binding domain-containing protein [Pyrinomonadaceae bacterium]|jgi:CRP-like cAMP-binding protein|nr:cyclic nucleotide-binding domain-containing protein [Pyrinomonadaceae bacterium]
MSTPSPQEMTLDAIRSVPLFASLDDHAASNLRNLLRVREVPANAGLFRAGDDGDAMYLIESGRVRITITDEDKKQIVLAELAQGDFFGEMAIIDGKKRSADATVTEQARLAILSREDFLGFIHHNPIVALEMLSATFSRLRRTDKLLQQRVSRNVNVEYGKSLSVIDRLAIAITNKVGSFGFFAIIAGWTFVWTGYNILASEVPSLHWPAFDPFPAFVAYLLISNVIQILLMPLIMVGQNLQGRHSETRAELDFQVNLKNEISLTEVLRRLDVLESERLPLLFAAQNERIDELKEPLSKATSASQ